MSELSPEARGLVDDWHAVLRPSADDRARIASALAVRLGAAVFALPQHASAAASKPAVVWQSLSTIVAGVSVGILTIGATYLAALSSSDVTTAPHSAKSSPAAVATASLGAVPVSSAANVDEALDAPAPATVPQRKQLLADPLAAEVAILSKATTALRAGNASESLSLVEEHQRRFPNGRLAEERRAARVQALCALGKLAAAEAELARLAQSAPHSPHLARAQRACGITP
jgi:hypothetical protein